jgi:hypothetical protein
MDHQSTIPSVLGPATGIDRAERGSARKPAESDTSLAFKLVFWAAVGVVLVCAVRLLIR